MTNQHDIYEAPKADLFEKKDTSELHGVLEIAKRQKALVYAFIVYILFSVSIANAPLSIKPLLQAGAVVVLIGIIIFAARLCWKLYGKFGAVVMTVLSIIPVVNLIVILIASSKANKLIKSKGFKVGFTGANNQEVANAIKLAAVVESNAEPSQPS